MGKKMKLPFLCKNDQLQLSSCMKPISNVNFHEEGDQIYRGDQDHSTETMITRGLKSDRLFFDPDIGTRSLLCKKEPIRLSLEEISVALAMDSADPYGDFRKSMEEMVEINGLRDWESLEELLGWYLRMNVKINHGFIVGAFVDLLAGVSTPCVDYATSYSSFSSSSSPMYSWSSLSPPPSPNLRARRNRDLWKKTK